MAIVRVQSQVAVTLVGATTIAATYSPNVTAGNLLVAVTSADGGTVSGVTGGGTWAKAVAQLWNFDSQDFEIWFCKNATGGATTVTVTWSGSVDAQLIIVEYSGIDTASPLDKTAAAESTPPGGNSTPGDSGVTATTTVASEVCVGGVVTFAGAFTPTNGNATLRTLTNLTSGTTLFGVEQIVAATGAYRASGSLDDGANQWGAVVATFKAPTATDTLWAASVM